MNNKFKGLGIKEEVLTSIEKLGYTNPSPIQERLIPIILKQEDAIGLAQTGTGKTLAYASSILSMINKDGNIKAMILVPTRELANQVCKEFRSLDITKKFDTICVYGGTDIRGQIKDLNKKPDIVVGTPGRLLDLIKRGKINLQYIDFFVLDEADEMLNMGFIEDIKEILKGTNDTHQVLMLSATMEKRIEKLAQEYMKPNFKLIEIASDEKTSDNVKEYFTLVSNKDRDEVLCRFLDVNNDKKIIVFCRTKKECDELLKSLLEKGYNVEVMHGDITQIAREKTLERFKKNIFKVLIATDVAARGIHVDNIDLVINYKLPDEEELYVHRIGRTGRAGNKGVALTLVTPKEEIYLKSIAKYTKSVLEQQEVPKQNEIIGNKYNDIYNKAVEQEKNLDEEAFENIRELNKKELMNLCASLMKIELTRTIGSNFDKSIEKVEKRTRQKNKTDKNSTRVFITLGKKDKLKKIELLDYLNKETKIDLKYLNNIEVLDTFSFLDVDNKVVDELIKKIYNKKYNNRIVRIEKANKKK